MQKIHATSEETLEVRAIHARAQNRPPSMKKVLSMETEQTPAGRKIPNFSILTEMTGGLRGLWVIGGATGTGKSTLAMNLVANVAGLEIAVLCLDMENDTGPGTREIGERLKSAYGAEAEALHYLHGFRRLSDLEAARAEYFPGPALIVIDHLQLLATGDDTGSRRATLDEVVRQCQDWVGEGYTVLALSQLNRVAYRQRPKLEHFKESSTIEAAATVALGIWRPSEFGPPRVHVVKVRQSRLPGYELLLAQEGWRLIEERRLPLKGATAERAVQLSPVQKALAKVGIPAKREAIVEAMRCSEATGTRRLADAVKRGEIRPLGKGWYDLPEHSDRRSK